MTSTNPCDMDGGKYCQKLQSWSLSACRKQFEGGKKETEHPLIIWNRT